MKKTFVILIVTACLSLVGLAGCGGKMGNSEDEKLQKIYSLYPGDRQMWEHIFDVKEPYHFQSKPFGVILPHHMVVAFKLAQFYEGLEAVTNPSVIVVVSPNHYENSEANIQTCLNCVYPTVNGDLSLDRNFIDKMIKENQAVAEGETFIKEHGVYAHAPFIKKYFPKTKIVPIALQWKMPKSEVVALSQWLDENLPDDALVIASVDFSHYIPVEAADFHDQSSFTTISNFDFENIYDLEIDSPSSIYLLMDLMKKRGYQKIQRFAHTNLQDFVSNRVARTTSHQFFGFFDGEVEPVKGVGIMSFGNNDSGLGLIDNWNWERGKGEGNVKQKTVGEDRQDFLKNIKGEEDRFFTGADFLVFDLDDGCVLKEQNGIKVSFCKNKFEKQDADLVYMLYDFKGEADEQVAKKFIDGGVDIFVGREEELSTSDISLKFTNGGKWHSYHGGLIFDNLGDFMVKGNSSGEIVDLYVTPENYFIYKFAIEIIDGYPGFKKLPEKFSGKNLIKVERKNLNQ